MPATDANIEAVRRFNRFFTGKIGVLGETLVKSPFTLGEARVLYELAHRDRATPTEIGQVLGLDAGYLSRMLADFVERGLVTRHRSSADGRQWQLTLTKKGTKTFAPIEQRTRDDVNAMLAELPPSGQKQLIGAMQNIERLLDADHGIALSSTHSPVLFREHRPGDMGWVAHRQAVLYREEYGWDEEFESLLLEITAKFLRDYDPKWERCWIAEQDGQIAGSVFVVRKSKLVAQLRMLYVEPHTRGQGIGRKLVNECVRFATQKKYETLTLWTNDVLSSARVIYEAAGFVLGAQEPNSMFGKHNVGQHWNLSLKKERR